MFSQEKAAQYLIVGWVKGWTLRTYGKIVAESESFEAEALHKAFPFLPDSTVAYFGRKGRGQEIRRFIADQYPVLNDAIWGAASDSDRLRLASRLLKLSGKGWSLKADKHKRGEISGNKLDRLNRIEWAAHKEHGRKSDGHHWAVVK